MPIIDHNIKYQPLMRTIRLVRLIVYYEMHEYEFVYHESRSINRTFFSQRAYFQNGAYHSVVSEPAASSSFEKRSRSFLGETSS